MDDLGSVFNLASLDPDVGLVGRGLVWLEVLGISYGQRKRHHHRNCPGPSSPPRTSEHNIQQGMKGGLQAGSALLPSAGRNSCVL